MALKINGNNTIETIHYNGIEVQHLNFNSINVWNKEEEPTVTYDYTVAPSFYNLTPTAPYGYSYNDKTWYALNNKNQFEKYGVYETVSDISTATTYPNKLINVNNVEYQYSNKRWNNVGDITGGFGLIGQIDSQNPPSTFPTDFYLKVSDVESSGWFSLSIYLPNGSLNIMMEDYSIEIDGSSYRGVREPSEIDGESYYHYYCSDCPYDSVDVMSLNWWGNPIDYFGSSVVYPIKYDNTIFNDYNLLQGLYYDSEEEVNVNGENIIYNIGGYLYKNGERTSDNPYALSYGNLSGNTSITKMIILDENVTSIGTDAFRDCRNISSVTMPNSVTSIGNNAFWNCSSLSSITIPDSVKTIGNQAFWICNSLSSVTLGNGLTSIGAQAFGFMPSLTSITIPDSVTTIGTEAFNACTSLTSVTIGSGVAEIGAQAFYQCKNVEEITFKGDECPKCSAMSNVYTPFGFLRTSSYSSQTTYCSANVASPVIRYPIGGTNYNVNTFPYSWFYAATMARTSYGDLKYNSGGSTVRMRGYGFTKVEVVEGAYVDLTFADGTTRRDDIGVRTLDSRYSGNTDIVSVEIGSGFTSIGASAFTNCTSLETITIPSGVTSIGSYAFYGSSKLSSITFKGTISKWNSVGKSSYWSYANILSVVHCTDGDVWLDNYISTYADGTIKVESSISDKANLVGVEITPKVTSIGNGAFSACTNLTSATIGSGVTSIGNRAFANCSSLTSIEIPDSVTSIGSGVCSACTSLTSATIGSGVTSIGNYAFARCSGLTSIEIANSVTKIGAYAFTGCTSLTSIEIPSSVTTIEYDAFESCTGLTKVNSTIEGKCIIPNSVRYIGSEAFQGCSSLTSIDIPNSVTSIGDRAFSGCTSLTSVTYNNTIEEGKKIFKTNQGLSIVHCIDGDLEIYMYKQTYSDGSITYGNTIVKANLVAIEITDFVTSIGTEAFYGCISLTSIDIPNSVTKIGQRAFYYCSGLTSITIPSSVTTINNWAFESCTNLTSIDIPNSVTSFGSGVFISCSNLTSATIGSGVTSINATFEYCKNLTSITYNGTIEQWQAIPKDTRWKTYVPSTCIIHCTDGDISISES